MNSVDGKTSHYCFYLEVNQAESQITDKRS